MSGSETRHIYKEEVIDRSTPVNNSLLTGSLYNVGACAHGGVLAWEFWSNKTNSKPEACDTGAPGAGAKLLVPRKRKRASEASERVASFTPRAHG